MNADPITLLMLGALVFMMLTAIAAIGGLVLYGFLMRRRIVRAATRHMADPELRCLRQQQTEITSVSHREAAILGHIEAMRADIAWIKGQLQALGDDQVKADATVKHGLRQIEHLMRKAIEDVDDAETEPV